MSSMTVVISDVASKIDFFAAAVVLDVMVGITTMISSSKDNWTHCDGSKREYEPAIVDSGIVRCFGTRSLVTLLNGMGEGAVRISLGGCFR